MDTQSNRRGQLASEEQTEASSPIPPSSQRVRASKNGHRDLAAWYVEELRDMRRAQPPGGPRIFNPDETPEEREVRIRETLAGLNAMQEIVAAGSEEDGANWNEVMRAVERSRSGLSGRDPDPLDS